MDADVLIVGGGIAGWSAAWFAVRAGRAVIVVDAGVDRASDLPIALVNPLRGHGGRLIRDGIAGMRATFSLVDALQREGHPIEQGRGLYRPLIDLDDALLDQAYWRARFAAALDFEWHAEAPASLGLVGRPPSLFLPEPGWIAAPQLLHALRVASAATLLHEQVVALRASGDGGVVTLANGTTIEARAMLWCGGASGAAGLDRATTEDRVDDALYKPGSLLACGTRLSHAPLAFGLYAVPRATGDTIVGPTREGSTAVLPDSLAASDTSAEVVSLLEDRVARTFGSTPALEPIWRGVRLARLSSRAGRALQGVATLTALDSRGFLMAPLLAARWAQSLSQSL